MYAVIEVGAKQYLVKKDDIIDVEKQDFKEGKEVILDKVLLVSDNDKVLVGQPYLKEAKVKAQAQCLIKGEKALSFKYERRKSKHWKKGHRQKLFRLKIKEVAIG